MKSTRILILLAALFSCMQAERAGRTEDPPVAQPVANPVTNRSVQEAESVQPDSLISRHSISLRFEDVTLAVAFEDVWNDPGYLQQVHQDTIVVNLGLGSTILGQKYSVALGADIKHIQVLQTYETSMSIQQEGPHLDLIEWKHYKDDWRKLAIEDNTFKTLEYTQREQEKFPTATPAELLEAVQNHQSADPDRWVDLAKKCSGPNGYPCGVSISSITLKLVLTHKDGAITEKYVIFEIPMGC